MNKSPSEIKAARELCKELQHVGLSWVDPPGEPRGMGHQPLAIWQALVLERVMRDEMLEALEFVEEFFDKLERDTGEHDPLSEIRRKVHAPIHNKLRPLIRKARGDE